MLLSLDQNWETRTPASGECLTSLDLRGKTAEQIPPPAGKADCE